MALDVLLVNPNRMRPPVAPLALEYLAGALQAGGLSCAVCDLCFADDPGAVLGADLKAHQPRLVALTMRNSDDCYCVTQRSFIPDLQERVAQVRVHCDAPVVIGGAGYSTAPEAILELTGADYGVVGDGEDALVQLARAVRDNGCHPERREGPPKCHPERREGSCEDQILRGAQDDIDISGLVWRDGERLCRNTPVYPDFGQTALPRDRLDNRRYFAEGGQGGLETKRGCPMPCLYCADPVSKGHCLRLRPPAVVVQEARNLIAQGVNAIHLCDSEFNIPLEHAKAVCAALMEAGIGDRWRFWAYLSPVPFDAELADLLVRAGCSGVNFGADSGDAEMLRRLGRQYSPDDLRETGRLCRDRGLTFMFDLLLGGPGETRESLRRTIELMKAIEPDCVGVACGMRLYAGTAAAELVRKQGFSPANPNLRGRIEDNEGFAWPIFFVEAGLGEDVVEHLREWVGGDHRFFFGWPDATQPDYNYDGNQTLVAAIAGGARGAYWDILRTWPQ